MCASSLRFVASLLELGDLQSMILSPVVTAWAQPVRAPVLVKEAAPLPLYVVANWEVGLGRHALRRRAADITENVLRGVCWRMKNV